MSMGERVQHALTSSSCDMRGCEDLAVSCCSEAGWTRRLADETELVFPFLMTQTSPEDILWGSKLPPTLCPA